MADSYAQKLTDDLLGIAHGYIAGGGITVSVKTNYGPEIRVGSAALAGTRSSGSSGSGGSSSGLSLSQLLGVKAAVIVRDRGGDTLAKYGEVPATDPIRVALALGACALVGYVFYRGVRSFFR